MDQMHCSQLDVHLDFPCQLTASDVAGTPPLSWKGRICFYNINENTLSRSSILCLWLNAIHLF